MTPQDAGDIFAPYGGMHALALVVCALLIVAPTLAGRRLSKGAQPALRRALTALAVCYWLAYNMWWNWNGLDLLNGLPLQLCDVNGLVAPLALMTGWRWARAALYFWTAALTLQAFIQPALTAGPASLVFWSFWTAHTIIAACAVYDVAVLGFRPGWSDLGRVIAVSAAYVALVVPVNLSLDSNYGYVGNPADIKQIPPFVYALGPWPLRAIILVALAPLGFVVVLLPWLIAARGAPLARQDAGGG